MHRASNTFTVLQAIAVVVTLAVVLWSLGLPTLQFATAAAVTSYSDTLSESTPSVASDHTITFTTPTGIANGGTIVLDFSDGPFVIGSVDETDVDVLDNTTDLNVSGDCSVGTEEVDAVFTAGPTLTITFCAGDGGSISASGPVTIKIGSNATYGGDTGDADAQMTNPVVGSYQIPLTAGASDTGEARVAIVDNVTVTASVDTLLNFSVGGVADAQTVHGTSTGTTTSATAIAFGELNANEPRTGAQDLTVSTNAANGFTVTVTADGQLTSNGSDIDGFRDGSYDASPVAWAQPTASVSDENTWGHWGIISDDTDLFPTTETWVSASTTAVDIMTYTGPVQATTTRVGYTVEISPLQEAGENYQAILTYIATPVF